MEENARGYLPSELLDFPAPRDLAQAFWKLDCFIKRSMRLFFHVFSWLDHGCPPGISMSPGVQPSVSRHGLTKRERKREREDWKHQDCHAMPGSFSWSLYYLWDASYWHACGGNSPGYRRHTAITSNPYPSMAYIGSTRVISHGPKLSTSHLCVLTHTSYLLFEHIRSMICMYVRICIVVRAIYIVVNTDTLDSSGRTAGTRPARIPRDLLLQPLLFPPNHKSFVCLGLFGQPIFHATTTYILPSKRLLEIP